MESLDLTFGGLSQGAPAYPAVSSKVLWWEWEAGLPATLPHQSVPECRECTRRVPEVSGSSKVTERRPCGEQ